MNAIILAGGLSTRMGEDKTRLRWGRSSLLGNIVWRLRPLVRRVLIVSHDRASQEKLRQEINPQHGNCQEATSFDGPFELEWVVDSRAERAPIVGVSDGLEASDAEWNAVIACDMPHVSNALLQFQQEHALSQGADGCFPELSRPRSSTVSESMQSSGFPRSGFPSFGHPPFEPLHGIYNRSLRTLLVEEMAQGNFSLSRVLARASIAVVPWRQCLESDPSGRFATNVNTPEDLSREGGERRYKWKPTEGSRS